MAPPGELSRNKGRLLVLNTSGTVTREVVTPSWEIEVVRRLIKTLRGRSSLLRLCKSKVKRWEIPLIISLR